MMINEHRSRIKFSWLLIVWAFVMLLPALSCDTVKRTTHKDVTDVHENNPTVVAFTDYVNANNDKVPDHGYINNALVKMADAVKAMAAEVDYSVALDLEAAKNHANKITQTAAETTHADNIRKAADILSSALKNMQLTRYGSLSVSATGLQTAGEAIQPDVLVRNQKEAIKTYLKDAAALLEKMN